MDVQELAIAGLVGSSLGAVAGAPLVWPGAPRRPEVTAFGASTVLLALIAGLISARLAGLVPGSVLVGHAVNLAGLGASACALGYIRLTTGHAVHRSLFAVPAAGYAGLTMTAIATGTGSAVPFVWILPIVLGFTTAAAWAVARPGAATPRRALVPPAWVVVFMGLVNVAQLARLQLGHVPVVRAAVPFAVLLGFAVLTAVASFRLGREPEAAPVTTPSRTNDAARTAAAWPAHEASAYARSGLDDASGRALLARVHDTLERDRLFARPDLTLARLAHAMDSTPHLVSEALNRVGGVSFRDVVTRCRVDDVKRQLEDADSDRYTIEGIGASAGFRSRSALYDAFRRSEGTTPTAYRDARRGKRP